MRRMNCVVRSTRDGRNLYVEVVAWNVDSRFHVDTTYGYASAEGARHVGGPLNDRVEVDRYVIQLDGLQWPVSVTCIDDATSETVARTIDE